MTPPTRHGAPPQDATLDEMRSAFRAALVALRRMRGRETRLHGQKLSYAQFGLLGALSHDARVSARELAEQAELSQGTVAQMLESLESLGLVERTRSTVDKRVVLTGLTDHGRVMLQARNEQMEPRWRQTLDQFADEELIAASGVLRALAEYFDEMG